MLVDPVKHYFYIWLIHVVGEGQVVDEAKRPVLPQATVPYGESRNCRIALDIAHFNMSIKTIILFKDRAILVYTNFFCSVCNF